MIEENIQEWEQELKEQVSSLLTKRVNPLSTELEKLEKAVAELRANAVPSLAANTEDTEAVAAHVRQILTDAQRQADKHYEQQLVEELEKARAEIAINVRQTLEADFERQLAQATAEAQQAAANAQFELHANIEQLKAQLANVAVQAETAPAPVASAAHSGAAAGTDYIGFKSAIEEIDAQRTQSETLTALIRGAARFAPRIVFFVVKGGDAIGWKATGFDNGLNDETARSLAVATQTPSMLMQALTAQNTAVAINPPQEEINLILGNYGNVVPRGAVAIPLVVRGKAAAVLYADSAEHSDDAIQLEAIETLMHVASMGIELLPVRRNAEPVRVTAAVPASAPVEPPQPAQIPKQEIPPPMVAAPVEFPQPTADSFDSPSMKFSQAQVAEPSISATPESAAAPVEEPAGKTADLNPAALPQFDSYVPPAPAETGAVEEDQESVEVPRSIFERIKAGVETEPEAPPVSAPTFEPPLPASVAVNAASDVVENTDAPTWMRRLETPEPETGPVVRKVEEPEPVRSAPLPATPPPMQRPSLANWGAKERGTGDLSATQPMGFQSDTPSIKVPEVAPSVVPNVIPNAVPNFNQPSDPPRYAAPSLSVSTAASETEVRAHNDARRFARLLVSEIKLYNAAKVNEGRRNADLYSRLRDEIDRSRKVYDKRVSPTVAAKFDYFYDELVQTLAEGDPSKLGESCPGPVVVTT